jgi:hypothetical protein
VNSPEIPFVRGRFLIPIVPHAAFFATIALSLSHRGILIPVYMLVTFGLLFGLNVVEGSRLGVFLKRWYPAECEKLIRRKNVPSPLDQLITQTDYGYKSLRGLWLSGLWLVLASHTGDDRILKQLRRHRRRVWIESLSTPLVMFVVIVSAVSVSKTG